MSPTRRDLIRYVAGGTVAAALASRSVVVEEPIEVVEEEPVTWSIATIMLDCSDGRRVCAMVEPERSLVNVYGPGNNHDHDSVWLKGDSNQRMYEFVSACAAGIAAGLEEEGAW